MPDFEILEHTADIGVAAYGDDLRETFANAARGLFSIITDLERVNDVERRDVQVTSGGVETLLVDWLGELLYIFDTENLLLKAFDIRDIDETHLTATVSGEKVDMSRHEIKLGVKAVTYHMLRVARRDGGYEARVIFDI